MQTSPANGPAGVSCLYEGVTMKIRELIERLQELERVHGNVPVAMVDGQ
jgi:hypothetical protein